MMDRPAAENSVPVDDTHLRFEQTVLPHLDAAYNLSRWLTASEADADDVTQEACLRALRFFSTHHGQNARAWLLAIVRNTCRTWLEKNRPREVRGWLPEDDTLAAVSSELDPVVLAIRRADRETVRQAIEELPLEYREAVVLRELEGLSYKEIAEIVEVPLGTVMSRLSRARDRLEQNLASRIGQGTGHPQAVKGTKS
jgi:RNA polymerase sigma factor (sigma-70 family)